MADEDLEQLTRDELLAEVKKLRAGIRRHRDSAGHELCWHHPNSGNFFRRSSIRIWPCRHGRSSCGVVCGTGSRSILSFRTRCA